MKHLKPFNESKDNLVEEIQDFCEMNLAYLLDDEAVKIEVSEFSERLPYRIFITVKNMGDLYQNVETGSSTWSKLKDDMIPFLTRLQSKYEIITKDSNDIIIQGLKRSVLFSGETSSRSITVDEIIKNLIEDRNYRNKPTQLDDSFEITRFIIFIKKSKI